MPRKLSEERTRKQMKVPPLVGGIDPQLEKAGWYLRDHSTVRIEIPACPDAPCGVDGYDAKPWNGVSDYCHLWSHKRANAGGGIIFYSYVSIKEL